MKAELKARIDQYLADRVQRSVDEYDRLLRKRDEHELFRRRAMLALSVVAVAAVLLAGAGLGYGWWTHARKQYLVAVVTVDKQGDIINVARAKKLINAVDHRVVYGQLYRFVTALRGVIGSCDEMRRSFKHDVAPLLSGMARKTVRDWVLEKENAPCARAKREQVDIQITSILPSIGSDAWQVDWIETHRSRNGADHYRQTWRAKVVIAVRAPDPDDMEASSGV